MLRSLIILIVLLIVSAGLRELTRNRETLVASGQTLRVVDGDSFEIGTKRLRLDGIDAPEYRQTCLSQDRSNWECGKASRANLEKLLRNPGLICEHEVADQFGRSIAICKTDNIADVGAAQVASGFAVSSEFAGMRDYPDEEDAAQSTKAGIWQGSFIRPKDWRAMRQTE